jgi:parallel beta-helix repeat protein
MVVHMNKKAQVAVEFLTTYGWVIVGVIILIAVLLYYGLFDPLRFVSRQCNFEPGLPCTAYKLESNLSSGGATFIVQLSNNLGYDISLPTGAILLHVENVGKPGKQTYAGNCSPNLPDIIKKGQTFTCIVDIPDKDVMPSIGKNIKLQPELSYKNCLTAPDYLTTGDCAPASNYTTAGTAITQMEAYSQTLYCGDGICSPEIGETLATCPADCVPGTLSLTATPPVVLPDGSSSSTITARLLDLKGSPVRDTAVMFSSDMGTLSAASWTTNSQGYAVVTITSTSIGLANITASAQQLSKEVSVLFKRVPKLALNAESPMCTGGSSSITATLTDQGGNPMQGFLVKLAHNSSDAQSKLTKYSDVTDASGSMASAFQNDTKIEQVSIQANVTDPSTGQLVYSGSSIISVGSCSQSGIGCTPPPTGDWVITTDILCINVTLPINGSIIIAAGASLTLRGAILNMSIDAHNNWPTQGIYVYGTLNLIEDWNGKPSIITGNTTQADCFDGHAECVGIWPINATCWTYLVTPPGSLACSIDWGIPPLYRFEIFPGANFTSNNSIIRDAGRIAVSTTSPYDDGLNIMADNAIIQNTEITHTRDECVIIGGNNVQLINNKIHDCINAHTGGGGTGVELLGSTTPAPGLPVQSASNAYVYGNEIYNVGTGVVIGFKGGDGASNNLITGNYIHNTGTGISVQNGDAYTGLKQNNIIQSNRITNSVYGVVVEQGRYAQLSSNNIHDNNVSGVYCAPSGDPNFNAVSDFSGDKISLNGHVTSDNCGTCHVVNGHGSECPTIPLNCSDIILSTSTTLTDDYILNGGSSCFVISNDNIVLDCDGHSIINPARSGAGIKAIGRKNVEIRNCKVSNYTYGILLSNSSDSRVTGSKINRTDEGIDFEDSANISVSGNSISSTIRGIYSHKSNNSNISNNYIDTMVIGIDSDTSLYISISNNTVHNSNMDGVYLINSNNVNVTSNTLKFNHGGISCHSSSVTFISNTVTGNTPYDCDASCTALGCPG